MNDETVAMGVMGYVLSLSLIGHLRGSDKISQQELRDILEQALLNLEHQQAIAGVNSRAVALARQLFERELRDL